MGANGNLFGSVCDQRCLWSPSASVLVLGRRRRCRRLRPSPPGKTHYDLGNQDFGLGPDATTMYSKAYERPNTASHAVRRVLSHAQSPPALVRC